MSLVLIFGFIGFIAGIIYMFKKYRLSKSQLLQYAAKSVLIAALIWLAKFIFENLLKNQKKRRYW